MGKRIERLLGILIISAAAGAAGLGAQDIQARWGLQDNQAVVGQGLSLNIEIQGVDSFDPPLISLPGIDVLWQGGSPRNSTSIVSMNGKTTRTVTKGFVGAWSLKARKPGNYHLDGLSLNIKGVAIRLPSLDWSVTEARQNDAFFVRQELSPATTVPGLEVNYRFVWFLARSAQNPDFTLPILDSPDIEFLGQPRIPPGSGQFRINYRGRELTGIKSSQVVNGQQFTTLSLEFRVRPKKTGTWDLADSGVTFQGMTGTRKVQDFFGDLVDEPQYDTLVARAQALKLTVTELPLAGKPGVFSGLIGKLDLSWSETGGKYQVGEPVRLSLRLKGVQNKPDLDLDHMVIQSLSGDDFTVIPDPEPRKSAVPDGQEIERAYIFRARHGGTLVIPPLRLNYFDPDTRKYGETASKALELHIEGSPVSQDASGTQAGENSLSGQTARVNQMPGSQGQVMGSSLDPGSPGQPVNPPGLVETRLLPASLFVLIPLLSALAGILTGIFGWWLHSDLRRRRMRRRAWLDLLGPLQTLASGEVMDFRGVLTEGRERLARIRDFLGASTGDPRLPASPGPGWKQRLETEEAAWDLAFFGPSPLGQDGYTGSPGLPVQSAGPLDAMTWKTRWAEFVREAEAWS